MLEELHFTIPSHVNIRGNSESDIKLHKAVDPVGVDELDLEDSEQPKKPTLPPTPLLVDNQSAVFSVNNPETSQRTRHLDVRYFKVRDYIKAQKVRVRHISTHHNVADFFTKGLDRILFGKYRGHLGMEDHTPPS